VKWKFQGEQAIRQSSLDYVIIRPYALDDARDEAPSALGIETSQGKTDTARRWIPRESVATLCHEALRMPMGQRVTFECWATKDHQRRVSWETLQPDPKEGVPDVPHTLATGIGVGGSALVGAGALRMMTWGLSRLLRARRI